jgi:hypothetical protein
MPENTLPMMTKILFSAFLMASSLVACQPRTPAEKAKDKIEDAGHETKQGMERAGDRIKDATN